jgi:predicted nuclease of predicted toxin-antitoxin system
MKVLLDQDVYAVTAHFLRELGHDVLTAAAAGLSTAGDMDLLETAQKGDRILVTRDRDFGALVFLQRKHAGVIYLRMIPGTVQSVHDELARVLKSYDGEALRQAFITVEPGRHRFRRLG